MSHFVLRVEQKAADRFVPAFAIRPPGDLCNGNHGVAGSTQGADHRPRATLTGQEIHALQCGRHRGVREQHHFPVGNACRTVGDCRPDVFGRQMRAIFQQLALACPLGEFA